MHICQLFVPPPPPQCMVYALLQPPTPTHRHSGYWCIIIYTVHSTCTYKLIKKVITVKTFYSLWNISSFMVD